MSAADIHLITH